MRAHHLLITSVSLIGLHACGDEAPPLAEAIAPRNVSSGETPLASCLTNTKLTLHHDDGTTDVTADVHQGFVQHARPGDLVELAFAVQPGCLTEHGPRVTLAAYTSPGITPLSMVPVQPPRAHDVHTKRVGPDGGTLSVRLPDCFFQLELAFGEPLGVLRGPSGSYRSEARQIAGTQGGYGSCSDVPLLSIAAFDTVERGWGEAPVVTHFGWDVLADKGAGELTCELDFEGDGVVDEALSPCPASTADIKVAELPVHAFAQLGEHRPELVVSDGKRRLWAGTLVLANHLDFKPGVRFPEQNPAFVAAKLIAADAPELSELAIEYSSAKIAPGIKVGDVVVGHGGRGYMLRVVKKIQVGNTLTVFGLPVGLDETIAGGYFGVRDLQVATGDAHCVSGDCVGTLTPVPGAPGDVPHRTLALGAANKVLGGEEDKFGIKLAVPLGGVEAESELELFMGLVVKKFAIDGLVFGDLRVDVDAAPTIEAAISVKAELEHSWPLGDIFLAALPLPVPVTIHMRPRIDLATSFKFAGKLTVAAPFQLKHDEDGWSHKFAPEIVGGADMLDVGTGSEFSLESKVTVVDELGFMLGFLYGPHVAPSGALGMKATVTPEDCVFCMTAFGELGGELGWEAPWGLGELLEPLVITLGETEFKKRCEPYAGVCDDDGGGPEVPGDPAPGGSWGDVHLVSHDGLLFDFQAGGEFVLVRATEGAPFEIQTRQEPRGDQLSVSYNTAVAAKLDGHRVGIYALAPAGVYVDGAPVSLASGASMAVGGGTLARDGSRYTLTWPTGEELVVRYAPGHLDLEVDLPLARAGAVEGLLGDADGDRDNDFGLGDGAFLPTPVGFDALYRGEPSFTAAWRVPVAGSLFDYTASTGPETYRGEPYSLMPLSTPAADPPHLGLAQQACGDCPEALRDTCMLDVAFTGDEGFADACHELTAEPAETMHPADQYIAVAPRYGAAIDCADEKIVFRGPDLANADDYQGTGSRLSIGVWGSHNGQAWKQSDDFTNQIFPGMTPSPETDWPGRFDCVTLGDDGYAECTLWLKPATSPCNGPHFPMFRFNVYEADDGPVLHGEGYFTVAW